MREEDGEGKERTERERRGTAATKAHIGSYFFRRQVCVCLPSARREVQKEYEEEKWREE